MMISDEYTESGIQYEYIHVLCVHFQDGDLSQITLKQITN